MYPQIYKAYLNVFFDKPNQHIRMISEGSCDTEDWSNNAENTALHHRNKLHFKMYSNENCYLKLQ